MPISIRDRKLLWTRSGNECAFPACGQQLVLDSAGLDVIVGEEAHIHSRKPGGPRADISLSAAELDGYGNLILLCPTHHTVVDAQPTVFTAPALREMKVSHERAVRERGQFFGGGVLQAVVNVQCTGSTLNVWKFGRSAVVVCSYGSPPVV
jgi:hypothetical protein